MKLQMEEMFVNKKSFNLSPIGVSKMPPILELKIAITSYFNFFIEAHENRVRHSQLKFYVYRHI